MRSQSRKTSRTVKLRARKIRQQHLAMRSRRSLMESLEPRQMLAAQVSNFQLYADTGPSSTDKITSDARLTGNVTFDTSGAHAAVQFDHTGDGTVEGTATIWTSGGSFSYDPRSNGLAATFSGQLALKYRPIELDSSGNTLWTGTWTTFTYTPENSALSNLGLVADTGTSSTDRVTSDPRLQGNISFAGNGHVNIQFDHNNDGVYEGAAGVWMTGGSFTYNPTNYGLSSSYTGTLPMRYRLVEYDNGGNITYTGSWFSYTYTIEAPRLNATVNNFGLVSDTGTSSTDRVTSDPRVTGSVTWTGSGRVDVQFDHNSDGTAEGTSSVYMSGNTFTYDPRSFGLSSSYTGSFPLRYRFKEFDGSGNLLFTGNWVDYTITLEAPRIRATLTGPQLVVDNGVSTTDKITSDPRLSGTVSWTGSGHVTVQFDHNGDGTYEGYVGVMSSGSSITYDPRSWGMSSSYVGAVNMKWRLLEYDSNNSLLFTGSWSTFSYTMELPHLNAVVSSVHLVSDTGTSSTDLVTSDPRVAGNISWTGSGHVDIQFDHNSDGTAEGSTSVYMSGTSFQYDPRSYGLSTSYVGNLPLRYRTREYDSNNNLLYTGDWSSFSFTVELPRLDATLSNLHLVVDDGTSSTDRQTSDPRVTGTVNWTGTGGYVQVQFDHNGDGTTDGSSSVMMSGSSFTYDPRTNGLASNYVGDLPLQYRLVELSSGGVVWHTGTWQNYAISITGPQPHGSLDNLHLVSDTGDSSTDLNTSDPRLAGTITGSFAGSTISVDFDHTGNGSVDGSVTINTTGESFTYDPRITDASLNSYSGLLPLTYRLVEHTMSGQTLTGAWLSYPFTLYQVTTAPEIAVFDPASSPLASSTGSYSFGWTGAGMPLVKTFTITNQGSASLTLNAQSLSLPSGFSLVSAFDSSVAPGASTTFAVRLDAAATGTYQGTVSFANNDGDENPYSFSIDGHVSQTAAEIDVRKPDGSQLDDGTGTLTFGTALVGTNISRTFAINNTGTGELVLDPQSLSVPAGFTVTSPFAATVAPGATTYFTVRLNGTTAGTYGGEVSFTNNDSDESPFNFHVSGTINTAVPEIEVRLDTSSGRVLVDGSDSIDFGNVNVGSNASHSFVILNTGTGTLTLDSGSLSLPNGYQVTSGFGSSVAPGGSTTLTIQFVPGIAGYFTGDLSFANNDSNESPFNFTLSGQGVSGSSGGPQLSVSLRHDTGTSSSDKVTSDPRLLGSVSGLSSGESARIEIDHGQDGTPESTLTVTAAAPSFAYDPRSVDPNFASAFGGKFVRLRVTEVDANGNDVATSAWQAFSYTLQALDVSATDVHLTNDTGPVTNDKVTYDSRVSLALSGSFGSAYGNTSVRVEFDHDADGDAEGTLTASGPGNLTYNPENADATFDDQVGNKSIRYRQVLVDGSGEDVAATAWSQFDFTLTGFTGAGGLTISELALSKDTGVSNTDRVTSSPTLYFVVSGTLGDNSALVQFDLDSDGTADAGVSVTSTTQEYLFDPRDIAESQYSTAGVKTFKYRLEKLDSNGAVMASGDWQPFTFTLEVAPPSGASVEDVALVNDTGSSSTDLVTSDGSLQGSVVGTDATSQAVVVEVDWDGNGTVDAAVDVTDGSWTVTAPSSLSYGVNDVQLRVREYSSTYADERYSSWSTFSFTLEPVAAPDVAELKLANDTGSSSTDGITSDLTISGHVAGTVTKATAIYIDRNGDNQADLVIYSDAQGIFQFTAPVIAVGAQTIRARTGYYDRKLDGTVYGAWKSLCFTYTPGDLPQVDSLVLANDTGTSSTDLITDDPTVKGQIVGAVSGDAILVQIDENQDGQVDSWLTLSAATFAYRPLTLVPGNDAVVQARTARWDSDLGTYQVGNWSAISFHYSAPSYTAGAATVALAKPLTVEATTAYDPAIKGAVTVVSAASNGYVVVEFDFNSDNIGDATTTADADGNYTFVPIGFGPGFHSLRARTKEWNPVTRSVVYGDWSSALNYTLEEKVNQPSTLSVALASDTGTSATDNVTSNSLLEGTIVNPDGSAAGLAIEIDIDHNGVGDAIAFTDANGAYSFQVDGLPFGQAFVKVRVVEWDEDAGEYLLGDWAGLTFTIQPPGSDPAYVSQFSTVQAGTLGQVTDSALQGRIINDGSLADVVIELDVNGDGTPEQRTVTDSTGRFQITPTGLSFGQHTVNVRARELDAATGQLQTSGWTGLSFEYLQSTVTAGAVSSLALVEDTAIAADGHTSNPAVTGVVTRDQGVAGLNIEIDHNGDDIPDGFATTDDQGHFTYTPTSLSYGTYTFRARIKVLDEVGAAVFSSWSTSLPLTYEADPSTAVHIASLVLTSDTGNSTTDGATANPAVQGTVAGVTSSVTVYFDQNGDGLSDGSTTSDASGNFSYTPSGLAEGFVVLRATLEVGAAPFASSGDATLRFVYSSDPDGQAAQNLLTSYNTYSTDWQTAQTVYNNALAAAAAAYNNSQYVVCSTYESAVANANQAREAARLQAQSAYDLAVRTADSAYASALAAAHSQFATDLANYSGDTTTFSLPDFVWPTQPNSNSLAIPDDSSQPTAPVQAPIDGQPYDFEKDPAYQGAVQLANKNFEQARREAEEAYAQAERAINEEFACEQQAADFQYEQDVADAEADYQAALAGGVSPIDMSHATKQYNDALQAVDAAEARDLARLAPGSRAPVSVAITTLYNKKREDLRFNLENLQHDCDQWRRDHAANALVDKEVALSAAARRRDQAIATAQRTKTDALADAAFDRDHDIEHARVACEIATSNARSAPVAAWDAAVNTEWTHYFKAMIDSDVDYVAAVATAGLGAFDDDLDSQLAEIKAVSARQQTLDNSAALLRESQADADASSQWTFSIDESSSINTQEKADNGSWHTYVFATLDLSLTHIQQTDPIDLDYDNYLQGLDAWVQSLGPPFVADYPNHTYNVVWSRVDAMYGWLVGSNGQGGFYRKQLQWSGQRDVADRDYQTALNNAWHTYQAGTYGHRKTRRQSGADHQQAFDQGAADHAFDFATNFANAYHTYLTGVADDDQTEAVAEDSHERSFADTESAQAANQVEDNANALSTLQVNVATAWNGLVAAWDASLGTAWSALQKALADASLLDTTQSAAAAHTNASGVAGKQLAWEQGENGADQTLEDGAAGADHTEAGSLADALQGYAYDVAQARRDYAYLVAVANHSHDSNVAAKDADYQTGASLRERDYQNALASLQYDPNTGGLNYDGPDYMPKYVAWNFKPWAGVSQGTSGYVPDDIAQTVRYAVLNPFRWNQKDLDYWLATAAIDRQYADSPYNASGYVSAKESLLASYRDQLQTEDETYQLARAAAERTKVIGGNGVDGDVQAHRTWVVGVEDEDVGLAQLVQTAGDSLADDLKAATVGLSEDEANAADQFTHDFDAAAKTREDKRADDDYGFTTGVKPLDNALTRALTVAEDAEAETDVQLRGNYELSLYQQHLSGLQTANLPAGLSTLNAYQTSVAQKDLAWETGVINAEIAQQHRITLEDLARLDGTTANGQAVTGELAAELTETNASAAATRTRIQTEDGAAQTLSDSSANAIRDSVIGVRTAEAADAARDVKAEDKYDVAKQVAERSFQQKAEDALVNWATSVEIAKYDYWVGYESERFHPQNSSTYTTAHNNNLARASIRDAAIAAADTPYNQAIKQAKVDHASDIGDAQITRAHDITQSEQTRESEAGDAMEQGQVELDAADTTSITTDNSAESTFAQNEGSAEKTFTIDEAKLSQAMTGVVDDDELLFEEDIEDLDVTHAQNEAADQADYVIAAAQSAATLQNNLYQAALQQSPQPENLKELQFNALKATAYAQWLTNLKDEYVQYVTSMVQAADDESVHDLEATEEADEALAADEESFIEGEANRDYAAAVQDVADDGAEQLLEATTIHAREEQQDLIEKTLQVGYAQMDENQLVGRTLAEKHYQMALAALDEGQTISDADLHLYWHEKAQAEYDWEIAWSQKDQDWTTSTATDDEAAEDALANEEESYEENETQKEEARTDAEDAAIEGEELAEDNDVVTLETEETNDANAARDAEYSAQGAWITAALNEQATQFATMAQQLNLPWMTVMADLAGVKAQWWASDGLQAWMNLDQELDGLDSAFTTAVEDLADGATGYDTDVAHDDKTFGDQAAADVRAALIDKLMAQDTEVLADDGADEQYQIDMLAARNAQRNGRAALLLAEADTKDTEEEWLQDALPDSTALSEAFSAAVKKAQDDWTVTVTLAEGNRDLTYATALRTFVNGFAAQWRTHDQAEVDDWRDEAVGTEQALETEVEAIGGDEDDYVHAYYASLAAAIHQYAAAHPSPWAARADAEAAAMRDREIAVADASENKSDADAQADETRAETIVNAEHDREAAEVNAKIDRWKAENLAIADREEAEGNALLAWAQGSGDHDATMLAEAHQANGGNQNPITPNPDGTLPVAPKPASKSVPEQAEPVAPDKSLPKNDAPVIQYDASSYRWSVVNPTSGEKTPLTTDSAGKVIQPYLGAEPIARFEDAENFRTIGVYPNPDSFAGDEFLVIIIQNPVVLPTPTISEPEQDPLANFMLRYSQPPEAPPLARTVDPAYQHLQGIVYATQHRTSINPVEDRIRRWQQFNEHWPKNFDPLWREQYAAAFMRWDRMVFEHDQGIIDKQEYDKWLASLDPFWQRLLGGLQLAQGFAEVGAAYALGTTGGAATATGVGAPPGAVMVVVAVGLGTHGGDNAGAGAMRLWTGEYHRTFTSRALEQYLTGDKESAEFLDAVIGMYGGTKAWQFTERLRPLRLYSSPGEGGFNFIPGIHDIPKNPAGTRVSSVFQRISRDPEFLKIAGVSEQEMEVALNGVSYRYSNILQGGFAGKVPTGDGDQLILGLSRLHIRTSPAAHELFHVARELRGGPTLRVDQMPGFLSRVHEEAIVWGMQTRYAPLATAAEASGHVFIYVIVPAGGTYYVVKKVAR